MSELTETRWTRYGKDRVYVRTADGLDVGHVDLIAQCHVVKDLAYEVAMNDCLARWCPAAEPADGTGLGDIPSPSAPLEASSPIGVLLTPSAVSPLTADALLEPTQHADSDPIADLKVDAPRDLVANVAGAAVRAKRNEVNAQAPVLNLFARVLGVKTEERAWRVGAKGEEKVAAELARLGDGWHRLHAIEVGERGSDIDHVVIGPPGVFTLNAKRHPHGKAWVGERAIMINGQRTDYLRNSRFEGKRAAELLSRACDCNVVVTPVIVFVDLDVFNVKQLPSDVHVTTRKRLLDWFRSLPPTLAPDDVEMIFTQARQSTTWQRLPR